jgi:pyoverdine/dityrosine biosynthesis protein Dit1
MLLISSLLIDLLSISDQDTWAYGEALRAMAAKKKFTHIIFSRLQDLIKFPRMPENLQEISYIANATNFRRFLFNKYGKEDIDIEHRIATDPDTLMTYRGYCRFLESDLQYIFVTGNGRTSNGYKRDVKYLAKEMLIRGYVSSILFVLLLDLVKISHNREESKLKHITVFCSRDQSQLPKPPTSLYSSIFG